MAAGSATSTRWCPTPEQLMILEEMYRGGVRTPNATQIQHITAHLSLYGKIEGKNVFYWFQNHKARDRQKLRRRLAKHLLLQHQHHNHLLCYPQFSHQLIQTPHDYHHHQFFNSIHPTNTCLSPPGFHPVSTHDYYSPCFIPPQGDASCEQAMSYGWKMETNPEMIKDEEPAMRTNGDDWIVISSSLNSRPVKTLELFPVSSSSNCDLNEESPSLSF